MYTRLRRLLTSRDVDGASAVEYALIVVAIAAVLVIVVFAIGRVTKSTFTSTCSNWNTAANTSGAC